MALFSRGSQMRGFGGYEGATGTRGPIDVTEVRRSHNRFLAENERTIETTLEHVAERSIQHAKRLSTGGGIMGVKRRSGAMADGWMRTPAQHTALGLVVSFYTDVKHAFFHEHGTGLWGPSHDYIRPKRARFLRWVTPEGAVVYAAKVRGVPPKFIGKTSWFQAGAFDGPSMFERYLGRVCSRF